jgi:UDP-3-O-[3-hydroxymyristoyl] glucosamine N-acyltransferase
MKTTVAEVARLVGGRVVGDPAGQLGGINNLAAAQPGELTFCDDGRRAAELAECRAGALLVREVPAGYDRTCIVVDDPRLALLHCHRAFFAGDDQLAAGCHPSAVVDTSFDGSGAVVGPRAVIERGVRAGPGTEIGAGAYIGPDVTIGDHCRIGVGAVIERGSVLGDRVGVGSGSVVGNSGFGFVRDGARYERFPQIGRAVLASDVEIGANCTINRGALSDTVIGRGSKLDDFVHVAHNATIGEHTLLAAHVAVAGRAHIGSWVRIGGFVGIAGGSRIGDGAAVGAWSAVIGDVPAGAHYQGVPAQPSPQAWRQIFAARFIPRLQKKVRALEQRLDALAQRAADRR